MTHLKHEGRIIAEVKSDWSTKARGSNHQEYQIYLSCANDGKGNSIVDGKPLKSFDEWINS